MKKIPVGIFILSCFIAISHLFAATLRVPSQYPTIQAGLNVAQSGDTVLVEPGTFVENLTWPYTDGIVLTSEYGPDTTFIDGNGSGRVIDFPSISFSKSTEITGFTIQNGYAVQGGGIITNGSPFIYGNTIQHNTAEGMSTWVYGGGIFCNGSGSPTIENNLIQGNAAKGQYWNYGGGIYIDNGNYALIIGNTIEYDSTVGGSWNYGSGIYCDGGSSPDIRHNIIQYNRAVLGSRGHGAGIYVDDNSNAYILSNLIIYNTTQSGSWNYGGGILINSGATVINNTIAENSCVGGNWNYGGGIRIYDSTNTIENNIVVNNIASSGGGIYAGTGGYATLLNNDVWNNTGGNYSGISPGSNDISIDPIFVSGPLGGYYLSQTAAGQGQDSPCIDYGTTLAESLGLNTYTTRTDTVPDSGFVDLGYHYPTGTPTSLHEKEPSTQIFSLGVYPSLVHSSCRIELSLSSEQFIEVIIYDICGRVADEVYRGLLSAGDHFWVWNGKNIKGKGISTGTYFVTVHTEKSTIHSRKVIVLQ
jgi:hypothetical protein